jgi:hypothetical protein
MKNNEGLKMTYRDNLFVKVRNLTYRKKRRKRG